jgi:ribosomal protein S21
MATNVEVKQKKNENSASLIKRFTKKVQNAGVLQRVRSIRYEERKPSDYTKKKARLKSLGKKAEYEKMYKMGKISGYGRR